MRSIHKLAGIEIGGTKLQLSIGDDSGRIYESIRYTISPGAGAEAIRQQIEEGLRKLKEFQDVSAIGVGFGGPVDWQSGTIRTSHQVAGWADFNVVEWLEKLTGKLVGMDNDANVAALGEAKHGRGVGFARVFYMTIGSGIGGGFVIDGEIYHGSAPGEVEVGHILLDRNGTTLESNCSGWAVDKKVKSFILENPHSILSSLAQNHKGPEAGLLGTALDKNDMDSHKIMEEIADHLSFALSHVVHLLHPDIMIIGGGLSFLGKYLRNPIAERLPKYVMKAFHPVPPLEISCLGENVVPVGGIELARTYHLKKSKSAIIR